MNIIVPPEPKIIAVTSDDGRTTIVVDFTGTETDARTALLTITPLGTSEEQVSAVVNQIAASFERSKRLNFSVPAKDRRSPRREGTHSVNLYVLNTWWFGLAQNLMEVQYAFGADNRLVEIFVDLHPPFPM